MYKNLYVLIALVFVLGLPSDADAAQVARWRLNETSGTTAFDATGNGYDGTLMGDPTWVAGYLDGALDLDGAGDYVDFGSPADWPSGQDPRSMSGWAKTDSVAGGWRWIAAYGSPATSQAMFIGINGTALYGGGYGDDISMAGFWTVGQWHHICLTYDGSTALLYADGVEVASGAKTWNLTLSRAHLGRQVNTAAEFWDGLVDDVAIFSHALSEEEIAKVMKGDPELSSGPNPEDGAVDVPREVALSWEPGEFAATHDVYLGTSPDDVEAASRANPTGVLASQGQSPASYDPDGRLEFDQTYYWRVDEVNVAPDNTIFPGSVWSFTTEPFAYAIEGIIAISNGTAEASGGPENTVNGSGLNANDEHSIESADMWTTTQSGADPLWIQFEFDRVYKLHEMLVWNYNVQFELLLGFGVKDVTMVYSIDGVDWTVLGDVVLSQGTAQADYAANTTVEMTGVAAQYVRLIVNGGFGTMGKFGLSEVRFLQIPAHAREPEPVDGAAEVGVETALSWRPGREAASHEVSLSTDEAALADGLALIDTTLAASADPGALDLGATYYWKVDEVNEAEAIGFWEGSTWSFSTQEYLVVEDFERYNDEDNRIYQTWVDGYGIPGNGSTVGHLEAPFAEQTLVHGGMQSMPLFYDNSTVPASEAEFTLTAQNWTTSGVKSLSLQFFGAGGNDGQLYLKINNTKIVYDGETTDLGRALWQPWNIDLSGVGGNLQGVTTLVIGVEGAGVQGAVYVDDIRLYPTAPEFITPVEPDGGNLVAHYAFDGDATDSSGNAAHGADGGDPAYGTGVAGQAVLLDGVGDFIDFSDPAHWPSGLAPRSMCAWGRTSSVQAGWRWMMAYGTGGTGQAMFVGMNGTGLYGGGYADDIMTPGFWQVDEWHHICLTYDGATARLYADGIEVVSGAKNWNLTLSRAHVGRQVNDAAEFWDGLVDEVRIYDRVLSTEEIAWLAGRRMPVHQSF